MWSTAACSTTQPSSRRWAVQADRALLRHALACRGCRVELTCAHLACQGQPLFGVQEARMHHPPPFSVAGCTHALGPSFFAPQVLEHMPPLEESAYDASLEPSEASAAASAAAASTASAAADLAALLGLDAGLAATGAAPAAAPPASQTSAVNALSDLLAGDLLGGGGGVAPAPAAPAPAAAAPPAATADPVAGLFGGPAAAAPAAAAVQTITAFAKGPLTVTFRLEKQPGSPATTDILATYSNSGGAPLESFTLQAAVPKAMQLRLEPASATSVPPHSAGGVSQRLHVTNSLHKALVMRLRINYSLGGQQVLEQAEVSTFPPGF